MGEHVRLEGAGRGKAGAVVLQDALSAEVQAYFSQWGPVNSCQLAHNDSALIALISRQGPLQVAILYKQICFPVLALCCLPQTLHQTNCLALNCSAALVDSVQHFSCAVLCTSGAGELLRVPSQNASLTSNPGCAYLQASYTVCRLTKRNVHTNNCKQVGLKIHKHCR